MTVFEIAHYLLYGALHLLSVILFKCSQFSIQSVKCMRYIPSARRSEKKNPAVERSKSMFFYHSQRLIECLPGSAIF